MKMTICHARRIVATGALLCLPLSLGLAADAIAPSGAAAAAQPVASAGAESATPTVATAPSAGVTAPTKLPYGVEDVLKLSRAQISEDVTLNYVHNTGTIYNLGPQDLVYLRNEGVSDRVINAMLDQRKRVAAEVAVQAASQPAAPANAPPVAAAPAVSDATSVVAAPTCVQPAPIYIQQPVVDVQPASAPSTVYVIPYPPARYAYYGYYSPYHSYGYYGPRSYGSYGYYGGSSLAFGFRFGGYGGGGWHGGGGRHAGGGYHR